MTEDSNYGISSLFLIDYDSRFPGFSILSPQGVQSDILVHKVQCHVSGLMTLEGK
ncbi:hypothetical protein MKW98_007094 [Papaver atlanticum]|uniref:Uncharacterized protein n=1 Tax=Papaver atlanticum TaxID=357466 RepID=A0AAD4XL74_9MAGN|nr:hypothetical protein MKW98_007094 [Papaver atlanticum]